MPFKIDPVALVLDVFTFGCYSSYQNIQRIINIDNNILIYNNIPIKSNRANRANIAQNRESPPIENQF